MLPPSSSTSSTPAPILVGLYARISDADEGDTAGVDRQIRDGEMICKAKHWEIHDRYIDNDISASKWDKVRPSFNRLLQDLESGVIQGIVGYDLDRLVRLPLDLERMIKIYDFRDGLVFATVQGDINLASDDGITFARVLVAFANKETRNISRRVKSKHAELARNGVPIGGARAFGYKASPEAYQALKLAEAEGNEAAIAAAKAMIKHEERRRLDPFEAQLIREGANDILAGHGIYEICTRWNEAGYRSPRGNTWRVSTIRGMYLSPKMAGYRLHRKEIARDDNGNPVMGEYEPILDVATWEAVRKELLDRAQVRARPARRKHLLAGLLRCGICSTKLKSDISYPPGGLRPIYRCPGKNEGGCGKLSVDAKKAEDLIVLLWKAHIAGREGESEIIPWPREHEIAEAEQQIAQLMEAFRTKQLGGHRVFPMVEAIERDLAGLKAERAEWIQTQHAVGGQGVSADDWDYMTIAEQQVELKQHFAAVVVHPDPRRGGPFRPSRIEPIWHELGGAGSGATPHLELVAQ